MFMKKIIKFINHLIAINPEKFINLKKFSILLKPEFCNINSVSLWDLSE